MKIFKSKNVEYVGLLKEKVIEVRKDLSDLRMKAYMMKEKL